MTQRALNKQLTPPGHWRARCPHCGFWLKHYEWRAFEAQVRQHNASNGHEEWDYETAACEQLPPGSCLYADGRQPAPFDGEMTVEAIGHAAHALIHLVGAAMFGDPLVDQGEAERRAAICARCPMNVPVRACLSCRGFENVKELIHRVTGGRTTSVDADLYNCRVCTCSLKTIVWIKPEILAKGFTDSQRERSPSNCWKLPVAVEPVGVAEQ